MSVVSRRIQSLRGKLKSQKYRQSYMTTHLKMFLAAQIRGLRAERSQEAFGRILGKPQSVVSRLESAEYGQVTLQTLLDIANKLDIALLVRFVSYPDFLRITDDFTETAMRPLSFDESENQFEKRSDSTAVTRAILIPQGTVSSARVIRNDSTDLIPNQLFGNTFISTAVH